MSGQPNGTNGTNGSQQPNGGQAAQQSTAQQPGSYSFSQGNANLMANYGTPANSSRMRYEAEQARIQRERDHQSRRPNGTGQNGVNGTQ